MGLLTIFQEDAPDERVRLAMQNQSLQEELGALRGEITELQEDLLKISDAFDNVGWSPLPGDEASSMPLKTVKKIAEIARAMNAINPFVKRGVNARISYVWGKGVTFDGVDGIKDQIERNRKKLFTPQAYEELERVLATDGNAFTAMPLETPFTEENDSTAFRIRLEEITGSVSNPYDAEEIWYYKRTYKVRKINSRTNEETTEDVEKYYISLPYYQKLKATGKSMGKRWQNVGIEQNFAIQHIAVNKQVGWRWGLPDVAAVIFWAKAYKEYLEDNATLVKAYSRIAWQIKSSSAAGATAAAAQVLAPPTRDPLTGELRSVGGTAVSSTGLDTTPLPPTGSSVDFNKGSALAAAIASGLEVSKVVITSDPGEGNRATAETLDLPTLKAMESRQQLHTERFLEIFEFWGADVTPNNPTSTREAEEAKSENTEGTGTDYAIVTWPQIESDTTKDRIAALGTGVELGIIYKQEARKEALDVFGIAPYKAWDDLPTMDDDPAAKEKFDQQQQKLEQQQQQSVIPSQGNSGGISAKGGAMSTSNQARDNRNEDRNKS